jgi:hypothetical protein
LPGQAAPVQTPLKTAVIHGAPEGHDARILAEKARALMPDDRVLLHIALDDMRAATLVDLLAFFAPDVRVIIFPAWDCLPYDRVSPNSDIVARRVAALTKLLAWDREQERYSPHPDYDCERRDSARHAARRARKRRPHRRARDRSSIFRTSRNFSRAAAIPAPKQ